MPNYEVSGAGDGTYNGTYVETGTINGKPAYTNGTRWLAWHSAGYWDLQDNDAPNWGGDYRGTGADLPATPWSQGPGLGTPPPPTVSEAAASGLPMILHLRGNRKQTHSRRTF